MNKPIFLTGVYRGGTTLSINVLNNHPAFALTYDSVNFFRYYLDRFLSNDFKDITEDVKTRINTRFGIDVPVDVINAKIKEFSQTPSLGDIYNIIMQETFCKGNEEVRWGEKSLLQWHNIPTFLSLFPEGKAIHLFRDPRDILLSYKNFTYEAGYRYLDAIFACLESMRWSLQYGKNLPKEKYIVSKYEDLINDPLGWSQKMCNFLCVDYHSEMINTDNFKGHNNEKWTSNSSYKKKGKGFSKDSIGKWKNKLSEVELFFVDLILGDYLNAFGYERSDNEYSQKTLREFHLILMQTPLLQKRFSKWMETGEGTNKYPSTPTATENWSENNIKE
jgi:hypothetical protein